MNKPERLNIRITKEDRDTIKKAAQKEGRSISNFVLHHILVLARKILGDK